MTVSEERWYELKDHNDVVSPSLLVYPDRIERNIRLMVEMAGDPKKLRPHIKTHKTAEIIKMQMDHGIDKFKCATIAEAELLGMCGVKNVLLALQPVGANIQRFIDLIRAFPLTGFSTLVDDSDIVQQFADIGRENDLQISLFLDLNTGMDRTGIKPDSVALELYRNIWEEPNLHAAGLHAYDGHIRNEDLKERKQICDEGFEKVLGLKSKLTGEGMEVPVIVAGGSPTFPVHAKREDVEASPGTTLLWDERYSSLFDDMNFITAAVLFSRVISKPNSDLICLDLGHKAIAPEMDFPRVKLHGLEDCDQIGQSEEHLVVKCPDRDRFQVGDPCYAIPMHICPTVAKYPRLMVVEKGEITDSWEVSARNYKITI